MCFSDYAQELLNQAHKEVLNAQSFNNSPCPLLVCSTLDRDTRMAFTTKTSLFVI